MIGNDWDIILKDIYNKEYFNKIKEKVRYEYQHKTIFPPANKVFSALRLTPYKDVSVVILGQDPYHGIGEANGLCFSVNHGIKMPPSLNNIYKELYNDLGIKRTDTDLSDWASQGVLLLNTVLTVRKGQANSHKEKGWEILTKKIIEIIGKREKPVVFMLWGSYAQKYSDLIAPQHLILKAPHPSPLSAYRGFFGCKHFSKCNDFLIKNGETPIDWK